MILYSLKLKKQTFNDYLQSPWTSYNRIYQPVDATTTQKSIRKHKHLPKREIKIEPSLLQFTSLGIFVQRQNEINISM